jgi:beta-lactamase class C
MILKLKKYNRVLLLVGMQCVIVLFTSFISADHDSEAFNLNAFIDKLPTPYTDLVTNYNNYLQSGIDSTNTVGAAVAIVSHDSIIFIKSYGVKKVGTTDSVDIHTLFRLASVSKGFAGVLASKLQEEGVLDLDETVKSVLPGFMLKETVNTNQLTIKQTLDHSSGIAPHAYDGLIEQGAAFSEIISQLRTVDVADAPGKVYAYQNAMYSLIDTILRIKTNCTYAELLKENIFAPLGMTDASLDYYSMLNGSDVAYPHQIVNGKYNTMKLNAGYYNVAPAAGVNASISDMSKWLKALLGSNPDVIDSVISKDISTPLITTPLQRHYTFHWGHVATKEYSLGWRIFEYYGHEIIYHGGFVQGYRAEIAFCPELKTGIVFLQNSPNQLAGKTIPDFWKMYFSEFDKNCLASK